MQLKMDEAGHVVVVEGKPVYVADDGKDIPFDAPHTIATIQRLNKEAQGHREAKEGLDAKLQAYAGIEDPEAARKAMEKVKNFSEADFIKAGEVDQMKQQWENASREQREAAVRQSNADRDKWKGEAETLQNALYSEKVGGAFDRSKFITDKVAIPADLLQNKFGSRFKVVDNQIVGIGTDGQPIYSRTRAGEIASFDEALESMIDAYPHRDSILKGTGHSGGGARTAHGGRPGQATITREAYDAMPPFKQAELMRSKDRPAII